MDINSVAANYGNYKPSALKAEESKTSTTKGKEATTTTRSKQDTIEKSNYTTEQLNTINQIKSAEEQRVANFENMIKKMLGSQANLSNISMNSFKNIKVTPEEAANAKAAISEGGEYSVKAVADRIMDMAIALSGGDDSKLNELRAAVEKGFEEAKKAWGGELPGICGDTYTEIMNRFDKWEQYGVDAIK
ncbi:MAG: hypothetical protein K5917_03850 [Clostridiales bacterium]|nr:hypothetical protein [Clostridiales bacterium]